MSVATELFALDHGALVIDLSPLAPPLRIRPWEDGLDVARQESGEWRTLERTADLRIALDVEDPVWTPMGRFVSSIPRRARVQAQRCGEHEVAALRLLRLHPRARVIARTPNLLWLVARLADERGLEAALAALDGTPSEVLAACLGGPIAPGAVGLLGRVLPEEREEAGEALFVALRSRPVVSALRHASEVEAAGLRAACRHEAHCTKPLLRRLLRYRGNASIADDWIDQYERAIALGHRLGFTNPQAQVDRGYAHGLFMRWRKRALSAQGPLDPDAYEYPEPPIAETATIVFVRNSAELFSEGSARFNCLFESDEECRDGKLAAYRVLSPERATLLICSETREIEDLRGLRNADVSDETRRAVYAWIASANAASARADAVPVRDPDPEAS